MWYTSSTEQLSCYLFSFPIYIQGDNGENGRGTSAWETWSNDDTEREVAKLMEEDVGAAMQFLQSKALCIMPISLAALIYPTTHQPDPANLVKPEPPALSQTLGPTCTCLQQLLDILKAPIPVLCPIVTGIFHYHAIKVRYHNFSFSVSPPHAFHLFCDVKPLKKNKKINESPLDLFLSMC